MSKIELENVGNHDLPEEQQICVGCGFCCDGTMFLNAVLQPGEHGGLPEKIEENYLKINDQEYFKLPCLYFDKHCSIYYREKAIICSTYRCQLLKNFSDGKISLPDALGIVQKALAMRQEIFEQYYLLADINKPVHFKGLLGALDKISNKKTQNYYANIDYEILVARCNIFEALLIKHFRSVQEFESLMITMKT